MNPQNTEIIIYQTEDGRAKIDVRMEDQTVWLTQAQMAELFGRSVRSLRSTSATFLRKGNLRKKAMCKICTLLFPTNP